MKTIILALFAVLLTTSIALAAWQETFIEDFAINEVETVKNALGQGASPQEMIDLLTAAGVEATTLVSALCGAGLSPRDLQEFLPKIGMSFKELITECDVPKNISPILGFPGANPDFFSVSKGTNYDGDGTPPRSASGSRP